MTRDEAIAHARWVLSGEVEGADTMPPERLAAQLRAVPWGPDTRDLMLTIADLIDPA